MKARCRANAPIGKIARSIHGAARDAARNIAVTDACQQSRKDRTKVEARVAYLERILKLDRLQLRGLTGANDEFLFAATGCDLRRMEPATRWRPEPAKKTFADRRNRVLSHRTPCR
jgi:hypothetical protein